MTTYGITPQGFVPEPLAQILLDIQAALKASFGTDIDVSPTGPFGQLIGILADRESTQWQLQQAVYNAAYPDTASGTALDDVCALTGVVRLFATNSAVGEVLIGTNATIIPINTLVSTGLNGVQFGTAAQATIVTLAGWTAGAVEAVGALISKGGNVYSCVIAGSTATAATWTQNTVETVGDTKVANGNVYIVASINNDARTSNAGTGPSGLGAGIVDNHVVWNYVSAAGGPTGTGLSILDGTVTWRYCGAGTAAVAQACKALLTGSIAAPAGTLTTIVTPIAGLSLVTNPLDAVLGAPQETDAALRLRRTQQLVAQGKSTLPAIQAALSRVAAVVSALVFENPNDAPDGAGRPPHSIECVVLGGSNADVATAIFGNKAAGIATTGGVTQAVVDPITAVSYSIKFTRPTEVPIYIVVNLKKGATYGGDAAVQAAVIAYANGLVAAVQGDAAFGDGQTVYASPFTAAILDQVGGIADITSLYIGTAPAPATSTPLVMTYAQLPTFDTSRISVVAT